MTRLTVPSGPISPGAPKRAVACDALAGESFHPWRSLAVEFGYRSLVSVPLLVEGQVIGVLNGYSESPREFTRSELVAVEILAAQAVALRLTMLIEARQETIAKLREANEELERQRYVLERAHETTCGSPPPSSRAPTSKSSSRRWRS
jgi:GAF domain-containing protein